jgi:hypothetical protein
MIRVFEIEHGGWTQSILDAIQTSRRNQSGRIVDFVYIPDDDDKAKAELAERAISRMGGACHVLTWYGEEFCTNYGVEHKPLVPGQWVELSRVRKETYPEE